jgi:predicted Fe-S protein YdhL (DUF1289 family)
VVKSPCNKSCCLEGEVCLGCFRTLNEISLWSRLSEDKQLEILKFTKNRRANYMSNPNTAKLVTERDELKAELVEKQKYILFLEAENKRLQEALEFYAGRENWHPQRDYPWTTKVIADWGAVAREALKEGDDR